MRKKSGQKAAKKFNKKLDELVAFTRQIDDSNLSDQAVTWAYEAALIKAYVAFEHLMLDCIVVAINNDTKTISATTGIKFPAHLTDEVCQYLVTGSGFFDFKGRDGLIKTINKYVPNGHWLLEAVKQSHNRTPLDRLVALRNFAAHESPASKRKAIETVGQKTIGSAGSWIKRQGRFAELVRALKKLANDIATRAPY